MALSMIDIFVVGGLFFTGFFGSAWEMHALGWNFAAILLCPVFGILSVLLFASPIYSLFRYRPMWLPICPHCSQRPDRWEYNGEWPLFVFTCTRCGEFTEVWMIRRVKLENVVSEMPCLRLCWPEFWGRWKRIQ